MDALYGLTAVVAIIVALIAITSASNLRRRIEILEPNVTRLWAELAVQESDVRPRPVTAPAQEAASPAPTSPLNMARCHPARQLLPVPALSGEAAGGGVALDPGYNGIDVISSQGRISEDTCRPNRRIGDSR